MTRWAPIVALTACVAMAAAGAIRMRHAAGMRDAQVRTLRAAEVDAREIVRLRSLQERVGARERPTADVVALVNQTLAEVGVPSRALRDLEQESDAVIQAGPPEIRRQTVRCTLEPLTIEELGRFLHHWGREHPLWIPTRIEITHVGRDEQAAFSCRIAIAATYIPG